MSTEAALRARRAGRGWTEIATILGTSVPDAKAQLAGVLAEERKQAAVRGGAHTPPDPVCHSYMCQHRESQHTNDGCSICLSDDDLPDYVRCTEFWQMMTPAERRMADMQTVVSNGMGKTSLGAAYRLGFRTYQDSTAWSMVQRARLKTRYARFQRKIKREMTK